MWFQSRTGSTGHSDVNELALSDHPSGKSDSQTSSTGHTDEGNAARANTGAMHHRSLPAQYQVSRAVQVAKALYRADHGDHSDHAVHYGCRKRPNESTTTML